MHWNVRRPSPPGGSARTKYAPQWGQVGGSACPIMAILRPLTYCRLSDPRLIKIEMGHMENKLGHWPWKQAITRRRLRTERETRTLCVNGSAHAGFRAASHWPGTCSGHGRTPPAYDPVDLDAVERAMLEQAGSEAIIKPTAPAFRTKSAVGPACGY